MFRSSDVEDLFTETNRSLQRSLLLLDEHQPAPGADTVSGSGDGAAVAVESLRGIGSLSAFLDAAPEMASRLRAEAVKASPAVLRQRRRGVAFPLVRRVGPGLRVGHLWAHSPPACQLWWDPEAAEADVPSSAVSATTTANSESNSGGGLSSSAAGVAGLLLSAAICADVAADASAWLAAAAQPLHMHPSASTALFSLLSAEATSLPGPVRDAVTARVSTALLSPSPPLQQPLPVGLLLTVPGWAAHIMVNAPPSLAARLLLRPLSAVSATLAECYLRSERDFACACAQCLTLMSAVCAQLLTMTAASAQATAPVDAGPRKLQQRLHTLYDALLLPLESVFSEASARPGMARALCANLMRPFAESHKPCLLVMAAAAGAIDGTGVSNTLANGLHTVHYRLLLLVERVGRAELSRETGGRVGIHTVAQQRKYESLLRASEGKITVNLLSVIAEDKLLVLEASGARSSSGHVIYRLHDGGGDPAGLVVYLYVDNGSVLLRAGRARAFAAAKSVEDIFKPFAVA